jgi:hypothetical protein
MGVVPQSPLPKKSFSLPDLVKHGRLAMVSRASAWVKAKFLALGNNSGLAEAGVGYID